MLLIPIRPEPASRIRSGRKWFELRKSRPPRSGPIYLLESSDAEQTVNAIRTCIITDPYIHLPLEELWERVGEYATSRKKFEAYFGTKYRSGVAIPIVETQLLQTPVTLEDLERADPAFTRPKWPWTYHEIQEGTPAADILASVPRSEILKAPRGARLVADPTRLTVRALRGSEVPFFEEMYSQFVLPYYDDSTDYTRQVLASHFAGQDEFGYLTLHKRILAFLLDDELVGFTVGTSKRGGSVKFGPTVIHPSYRELGLGRRFRLLAETEYPRARKFYNTLPADSDTALRYVLQAGYRIEAHLRHQYSAASDELVVGKVRTRSEPNWVVEPHLNDGPASKPVQVTSVNTIDADLASEILRRFELSYGELDPSFVESLRRGLAQERSALARKPKQIYLARDGDGLVVGIAVMTPKRGGSIKCSPLSCASWAVDALLQRVIADSDGFRKLYLHVPLLDSATVSACGRLGFVVEGVLEAPYRDGVDMVSMARESHV